MRTRVRQAALVLVGAVFVRLPLETDGSPRRRQEAPADFESAFQNRIREFLNDVGC